MRQGVHEMFPGSLSRIFPYRVMWRHDMRQMGFLSWVFLVLLVASIVGVDGVAAQVNGNDVTRVAVYGSAAAPTAVSSVAALTTTWGKYKGAWSDGLKAVIASVGSLSGGSPWRL